MVSEVCVLSSSSSLAAELDEALADDKVVFEPVMSGESAAKRASCGCSSAILIDESPPDTSTAELLRALRSSSLGRHALVILMSSKDSEIDRVIAFELGADDFIAKPIGIRELSLRLAAVLRRHQNERRRNETLQVGPFVIDSGQERVTFRGEPLALTSVEFRLLEYLARSPGQVHERRVLLERVWRWCDLNDERAVASRTVDTHVKRLREKLGAASELVETIRGVGYRLRLAS